MTTETIKSVSEDTFVSDVIEKSKEKIMIVDFWAPWCGPCKQLTPIIERQAHNKKQQLEVVFSGVVHVMFCFHTVDGQKNSPPPLIGPFKGINKENKRKFFNLYIKFRVQKLRFLAFSRGSGGFRELREAGRKHFHLSWYLSVPVVTSYDQKP